MRRLTEHSVQVTGSVSSPRNTRLPRVGLRGGPGKRYTLAERLDARTTRGPGCWICEGYQLPNGYVQISLRAQGGTAVLAHRLAYELAHGPIPKGLVVMHSCDQPNCVNPAHLSVGTQAENIHDSIQKGRYNTFGRQKLNAEQVREIRALWARGWRQIDIAAKFGIKRSTVSGIVNNKSWQHLDRPFGDGGGVFERVPHVYLEVRGEVA